MAKHSIPRSRIPKVHFLCPKCESGMKPVMGSPFADGYHRRHVCMNPQCGAGFYTLAPYNGGTAQLSGLPFKDRPLTEFEEFERRQWWQEEMDREVTTKVISLPILEDIRAAMCTKEDARTQRQKFLVGCYQSIEKQVARMDATQQEEDDNGREETGNGNGAEDGAAEKCEDAGRRTEGSSGS